MKFFLDQDVYAATFRFLKDAGHDVITASEIGRAKASDSELLTLAQAQSRIFVTRDRDFGGLVFLSRMGAGIIYLRILPSTIQAVHQALEAILATYSEADLREAFVVVEPGRHRFRRLPA